MWEKLRVGEGWGWRWGWVLLVVEEEKHERDVGKRGVSGGAGGKRGRVYESTRGSLPDHEFSSWEASSSGFLSDHFLSGRCGCVWVCVC